MRDICALNLLVVERSQTCQTALTTLRNRRKEIIDNGERDLEQPNHEAEETVSLKRPAEDEDDAGSKNEGRTSKRKEQHNATENEPTGCSAHRPLCPNLPFDGTFGLPDTSPRLSCNFYSL